ncbi:MerR family transcriptional regulator [Streptomyces caatingaensis]|uniref:MerR family transcriptional regulator n=1 Tax=Streptomyces caatingaensis TaxID=1678637 RepID=A0A0K9XHI6_9ACTN|nr:MerR family transcriptional regulator [Streptomyces caatingaensis]KNB52142.1 MerR family transcriptional regulator [Streptomyces caatingaensis]
MLQRPSGGAGSSGSAGAEGRPVSIGTVLNLLRDEFPEVTISKIRFLEAEGLVEPKRTPSGYRKFSPSDVERLAQVLRMQRDHYLPLKVIREHLDALERGERVPLPSPGQPRDALGLSEDADEAVEAAEAPAASTRVGRAELLAAAGVSEAELAEWESYGLVTAHPDGAFAADSVAVARLVADLGRFGLEPRHLRAVKAAADREAGLIEQVVAPLRRHRNPQTRAHAEATARELAGLSVRLHAALVRSALQQRGQ